MKKIILTVLVLAVLSGCSSKDVRYKEKALQYKKDSAVFCGKAGILTHIPEGDDTIILCKDGVFKWLEL